MKNTLLFLFCQIFLISNAQHFDWANSYGSTGADGGKAITVDQFGNIYTVGYFNGTVDFDPNSGTYYLTSNGDYDCFIQKVDSSGNFVWAKSFGGTSSEMANSIVIDAFSMIYIKGYFRETVDFNPGINTNELTASMFGNMFLLKLDSDGEFQWVKDLENLPLYDKVNTMAISGTNIIITGQFSGTMDFDPNAGTTELTSNGGKDIYIQKIDILGNFVWAKNIGGIYNEEEASAITTDNIGNIYIGGSFVQTLDFDPNSGTNNVTAQSRDNFILKLNSFGGFEWVKTMGGTGSSTESASIILDSDNNIYNTGTFSGTSDFDPNTGTSSLTSAGSFDVFIQKLDNNGNLIWVKSFGGNKLDKSNSITLDNDNNVYTTGYFYETVDFDTGNDDVYNLTTVDNYKNIFVHKLTKDGVFEWAVSIGEDTGNEAGNSILSFNNKIYTTGYYIGTVDFDFSEEIHTLTSKGHTDIFLLKIDPKEIIIEDTTTSIFSINTSLINIYPNPSKGIFNFDTDEVIKELIIYNNKGQIIKTSFDNNLIDVSKEIDGVYYIDITTKNRQIVHKIMKK